MKKLLLVVALLAVGVAFGYTQSLGTAGDEVSGGSRDVLGEGTANEAYVYAKFTLTGIEFQVIDLADATCMGDVGTDNPGNDVWILTAVRSGDDIAQWATADIPFVIENRGALALDLGMWNDSPLTISTAGDDWDYQPVTTDISYALNQYKLFGVFTQGDWAPATEAIVKGEMGGAADLTVAGGGAWWIGTTLDWYTDATHFTPETEANDVFDGRTNLNLPAACGTYSGQDLLDYCQLRLRLAVSEGGTDQYGHAVKVALVSRITEGL
ncbi:hypothetical protein KAH81_03500 [bacterium]|nr:hypothetical protein [bacterium]